MKIGLRGGHSPNCKGAMGILDEQAEVRKIYSALAPMLQAAGHTVVNCNSDAGNVDQELADGTNAANRNGCEIYVTIHMNAASANANGTEVWMYNNANGIMNQIATNICAKFAAKGFPNRGVKFNTGYHDLNASAMPAMIVETLFCTGNEDAARYRKLGASGIAKLIAEGITGKNVSAPATTPVASAKPETSNGAPKVVFGVRTLHHGILAVGQVGKANDAITAVQIGVTQGNVKYRVHAIGVGWFPPVTGANWKDHENGYAGDNEHSIDAIQIYYETDINKTGKYYSAVYKVKPFNSGSYLPAITDTNWEDVDGDGTAGMFGVPFTQLAIELK